MFPAELKIRDSLIRPATILAPMAGVTDTVFRRVIRSLGACGLIMTEFTSAEGLTRQAARTLRYLYFDEDEHPIAGQIFGSDPNVMASAAALIEDLGFDHADINLGCPVKKVVKCGGSGLLRDLVHLEKLLRAVRAAVTIPLTIKIRSGWDENNIVADGRGANGGTNRRRSNRRSPAHAHAGLCRICRLDNYSRGEAMRAHSGDWQWRYPQAGGRRAHDRRNRLRRNHDRPHRIFQSVDLQPDRRLHFHGKIRPSRPKSIAIISCQIIFAA